MVSTYGAHELIIIPYPKQGMARYLVAAAILLLLVLFGPWGPVGMDDTPAAAGDPMTVFWLIIWGASTFGSIITLCALLRESIPRQLVLNHPNLSFDPGRPPLKISRVLKDEGTNWRSLFPARRRYEFTPLQIATLRLLCTISSCRITIDRGRERIDLGADLSKAEGEWLYARLKAKYG